MSTQPTNAPVSSVTPVNYQRNRVNGLDALQSRQQGIEQNAQRQTQYYTAALAQKKQNDAIEQAKRDQEALLAQQQQYSQTLASRPQSTGGGGTPGAVLGTGLPNGQRPSGAQLGNSIGDQAVRNAEKYLGMDYQWGGSNPNTSFDCSGLTSYVYKSLGINLPRVSNAQAISGQRTDINSLRPGDLVAWDRSSRNGTGARGADHIAIYAGNGWIIEAAKTGTQIRYRQLGSADASAWGVRLAW